MYGWPAVSPVAITPCTAVSPLDSPAWPRPGKCPVVHRLDSNRPGVVGFTEKRFQSSSKPHTLPWQVLWESIMNRLASS